MTAKLDRPQLYEAAGTILETIGDQSSLLKPSESIWTPDNLKTLKSLVVDNPNFGPGSFEEKLRDQVSGSSDEVVILAAEAMIVWFLKDDITSGAAKREEVEVVLSAASTTVDISESVQAILDTGLANPGQANLHKRPQYGWLVEFGLKWIELNSNAREKLLADPWQWKEFLAGVPGKGVRSQRLAMLHLVHPNEFEPMINLGHKRLILRNFGDRLSPETPQDIDRQLLEIREALEKEPAFAPGFQWYAPEYRSYWDLKKDAAPVHLLLRWSPANHPDTISLHMDVVQAKGSVWWGKRGDSGARAAIGKKFLKKIQSQLEEDVPTHVYLYRPGELWRASLISLTFDRSEIDEELVPSYYGEEDHNLWVELTDFEQLDNDWAVLNLRPAGTRAKTIASAIGGQSSLIYIHEKNAVQVKERLWVFQQKDETVSSYGDVEGDRYLFDTKVQNQKALRGAQAEGQLSRFIYYRPESGGDPKSKSFYGYGKVESVVEDQTTNSEDAVQAFFAKLSDYSEFTTPVPLDTLPKDPRPSAQNAINEITLDAFMDLLRRGGVMTSQSLTVESLRAAAEANDPPLKLPEEVYANVVAAVESDKHIILTGPPGTAKTTLAEITANVAKLSGLCSGYMLTTATADWTTFETIGGLRPTADQQLEFSEGHFLEAIRRDKWLVIDELNRANFDAAFGQLFTVLSGQAVVLPYDHPKTKKRVALVPEKADVERSEWHAWRIPDSWQLIATMNVFDKSLLFKMSFALMRRFAFIEVPPPSVDKYVELIRDAADEDEFAVDVAVGLLVLRRVKEMGPAIYIDLARFAKNRLAASSLTMSELTLQCFYSYLLPQFEGVDDREADRLYSILSSKLVKADRKRLKQILKDVLGVDPRMISADGEEDDDEEIPLTGSSLEPDDDSDGSDVSDVEDEEENEFQGD